MSPIKFAISPTLSAFERTGVVGSKVIDSPKFLAALERQVEAFDWPSCRTPGQAFIVMPEAIDAVSCGEAKLAGLSKADLHPVFYREEWGLFADRSKAAKTNFLAAIVYTIDAWNLDPQVIKRGEQASEDWGTHVVVAVIASATGAALSSTRLVRNLAGGNNAFSITGDDAHDAKVARHAVAEAHKAVAREATFITVADRDA